MKRPELYAGEVFATLAAQQGVELCPRRGSAGRRRGPRCWPCTAASRWREILREMLKHSTNLTAEVTGSAATRAVGRAGAHAGRVGCRDERLGGASVAGFPLGDPEFRLVNHSGLTLDSRVSPRRLVALLAALARRGTGPAGRMAGCLAASPTISAIRRVGQGGADRLRRLEIVAKTGTMSYVRGLAGYIDDAGRPPAGLRGLLERFRPARRPGPERVDRAWMGRAKAFERALIRNWVLRVDGAA